MANRWKQWARFLQKVEEEKSVLDFKDDEEPLFRGHASAEYVLLPSLYRLPGKNADELWELESDLFFEFQARSRDVQATTNDWDVLFHMRHYGLPTRLLDWTECLGVALFFAVLGHDPAGPPPCIWLLNPWRLNEKSWKVRDLVAPQYLGWDVEHWCYDDYGEILANEEEVPWDIPVAIYPRQQSNPRMAAQRGVFTIHGNDPRPLDKQAPKCVRCVVLKPEVVAVVVELLDVFGLDQYLLFPDSVNLGHSLGQKYQLPGSLKDRVAGRTYSRSG